MNKVTIDFTKTEILHLTSILEPYMVNSGDSFDRQLWLKIKSKMKEAYVEINSGNQEIINKERTIKTINKK